MSLSWREMLPVDVEAATLVGRIWIAGIGPSVVVLRDALLVDITRSFPTMRDLTEQPAPAQAVRAAKGEVIGKWEDLQSLAVERPESTDSFLLAPLDLHAVKAAGVTFVTSLLERLVEERAGGSPSLAAAARDEMATRGVELKSIAPGGPEALRLRERLLSEGAWSGYLEVGLGPDAELFTKSQPLSAVGAGSRIGVPDTSGWNNPEPEIVLAIASHGRPVGATLGNDLNLRDVEGRSALLLGRAKDNVGSCAIGPFIRLFDAGFSLEQVRSLEVELEVLGSDGFRLASRCPMSTISRDPSELAAQLFKDHQYPDGAALFLGTPFAPTDDRDVPGLGFTHRIGDLVRIRERRLGTLFNTVSRCSDVAPWTFGISALMRNLSTRALLT